MMTRDVILVLFVFTGEICLISMEGENVARGGQVSQSSLHSGGYPEKAIDGNRASVWSQNTCTHTNRETNPWWRVDLQNTYKVHSVKITNRKDCCPERINGAEIRIGNSLNDNGNGNPRCAVIGSIPAGNTMTFTCNGMEGQFVSIVIPGRNKILTLCEVEVFGTEKGTEKVTEKEEDGENVARGGQVAQSSLHSGGNPERAIDGNRASVWSQKSCTHTNRETNPWWRVDLRKTRKVHSVKITNRKDCCAERINGAEIRIGNDNGNGNPRCAVIDKIPAGNTMTFACNGMEGQFVSIVIPGRNKILTLCEVEVFGAEKEENGENVAQGGQVAQSSLDWGGNPERAIDGNRASLWSQNSCTHTHKETNPWWRVDLQKTYKVHSVKITNRKDCCVERINGAEIRIGNDNGNGNTRCAVIDSIPAGNTMTFACNGMEGQFVSIVIPGQDHILTLCEVEVFGTETDEDEC